MSRSRSIGLVACAVAAGVLSAQVATAQPRGTDPAPRFEIGVGFDWIGGASFGTTAANEVVASGAPFPLFSVSTELGGAAGASVRVARRLRRAFTLEGVGSYSRPELRATTAADTEGAPGVTATDRLRQFTIEGAVLFSPARWRLGRRALAFVSGGAGYLRQVHEGDAFAEDGQVYAFGGGLKIPLLTRESKRLCVVGLRADVRAVVRSHGVATDLASHMSPAVGVSGYFGFLR